MRRGALAVVGVALAAVLAACSPGPSAEERVAERAQELSPAVADARVEFQKDIFTQNVIVELSVRSAEDAVLISAVEAAFLAAWEDAGFEPSNVSVKIAEGELPPADSVRGSDYVDLDVLVPHGLDSCDHSSPACVMLRSALEAEFGEWEKNG